MNKTENAVVASIIPNADTFTVKPSAPLDPGHYGLAVGSTAVYSFDIVSGGEHTQVTEKH